MLGNQRVGRMTKEEMLQCFQDVKSWFQRNGCDVHRIRSATSADFQRLQKAVDDIPDGLDAFLLETNGGLWFGDKISLSTEVSFTF